MSHERLLFTSESVTSGHPDKLCDAISDAILDACLEQDPGARVACETLVKGMGAQSHIVLAGEISIAGPTPDYEAIARSTAASIGYTSEEVGMDANSCQVEVLISTQSQDISRGVGTGSEQRAGDQGVMFGYATSESESYPSLKGKFMPLSALLSQALTRRLTEVREQGILPWARPDGKSQVTIEYGGFNKPRRIWAIVIAIQHDDMVVGTVADEEAEHAIIVEQIREHVIDEVIPSELIDSKTDVIVNGTGRFVKGGPFADAGLTGRKIIVDTYGGMGRHGGGAFSGKDPSKVDRSAAYAARWAAKHVVAAGLAEMCEIQLAYAIGVAEPVSIRVMTNGSSAAGISEEEITRRVRNTFDFRPGSMVADLGLLQPIYAPTSAGGHFGREPVGNTFPWERLDEARLAALRNG